MEQMPAAHCSLLAALEDQLQPPQTVIIRGPIDQIENWRKTASQGYKPWRKVYAIPYEGVATTPSYLPRLVSSEKQARPMAYVCQELTCSLPIETLESLESALA